MDASQKLRRFSWGRSNVASGRPSFGRQEARGPQTLPVAAGGTCRPPASPARGLEMPESHPGPPGRAGRHRRGVRASAGDGGVTATCPSGRIAPWGTGTGSRVAHERDPSLREWSAPLLIPPVCLQMSPPRGRHPVPAPCPLSPVPAPCPCLLSRVCSVFPCVECELQEKRALSCPQPCPQHPGQGLAHSTPSGSTGYRRELTDA